MNKLEQELTSALRSSLPHEMALAILSVQPMDNKTEQAFNDLYQLLKDHPDEHLVFGSKK